MDEGNGAQCELLLRGRGADVERDGLAVGVDGVLPGDVGLSVAGYRRDAGPGLRDGLAGDDDEEGGYVVRIRVEEDPGSSRCGQSLIRNVPPETRPTCEASFTRGQ